MTQLNSLASDLQWIRQVRSLLIDVARASLSDLPKLPQQVTTDALPLAQQAKIIQENAAKICDPSTWQYQEQEWIETVRQLLLELSRISLSESLKLPDDIAQRTLTLVETAQDIQETIESHETHDTTDWLDVEAVSTAVDEHLNQVRLEIKTQQATSTNPEAPQWNQILALVDQAQVLYHQIYS